MIIALFHPTSHFQTPNLPILSMFPDPECLQNGILENWRLGIFLDKNAKNDLLSLLRGLHHCMILLEVKIYEN